MLSWLIPAVLGLVGGVVGSLVAPWVHWAIEKERSKIAHRRKLIETWREELDTFPWDEQNFGESTTYAALRPHLSDEIIATLEHPRMSFAGGGRGENVRKQIISDEIARIEREWELV